MSSSETNPPAESDTSKRPRDQHSTVTDSRDDKVSDIGVQMTGSGSTASGQMLVYSLLAPSADIWPFAGCLTVEDTSNAAASSTSRETLRLLIPDAFVLISGHSADRSGWCHCGRPVGRCNCAGIRGCGCGERCSCRLVF
jgi:hypothetical protein